MSIKFTSCKHIVLQPRKEYGPDGYFRKPVLNAILSIYEFKSVMDEIFFYLLVNKDTKNRREYLQKYSSIQHFCKEQNVGSVGHLPLQGEN